MSNPIFNTTQREVMRQQKAIFSPLEETFKKYSRVRGLYLPDGNQIIEMNNVSGTVFGMYRRQLSARAFSVKGTWSFVADPDSITFDFERD